MAFDCLPKYDTVPETAGERSQPASDEEAAENVRSTTLSACNIALSTISGPHTSLAPCLSAKSRVGTVLGYQRCARGSCERRTGAGSNHGREHDSVLVIVWGEGRKLLSFGLAGSRR